jgi:hypothetical protein
MRKNRNRSPGNARVSIMKANVVQLDNAMPREKWINQPDYRMLAAAARNTC